MSPLAHSRFSRILALLAAAACGLPGARAQDGQPVDAAQMLQALRQLRDQTAVQTKASKQKTLQEVSAAATNGENAVLAWEKAVMATQFDGMTKEAAAFKAWREAEGEALKETEAKNAARLYFIWLSLTLQRSAGLTVKELLPALLNYTKELANDQATMEALEESMRRDKERGDGKHGGQRKAGDHEVKKMHDSILNRPLSGSIVVQWLKIGPWVAVENWEETPGNLDGIFEKVILPELRAQRDPRLLDYWDNRIKREGDHAMRAKLEFERDKFLNFRLPVLSWRKTAEYVVLGQKNRAVTEMLGVIRKYPTHPSAGEWMAKLEEMLAPPAPSAAVPSPSQPLPSPAPAPPAR